VMIVKMMASVFAILALVLVSGDAHSATFLLQAEKVDALAGGPIVVKLTLIYQGEPTLEIVGPTDWGQRQIKVEAPAGWIERKKMAEIINISVGQVKVKSGDRFTQVVYLHHNYTSIPKGKAAIKLTWPVSKIKDPAAKEWV